MAKRITELMVLTLAIQAVGDLKLQVNLIGVLVFGPAPFGLSMDRRDVTALVRAKPLVGGHKQKSMVMKLIGINVVVACYTSMQSMFAFQRSCFS